MAGGGLAGLGTQKQEQALQLALQSFPRSASVAMAGTGGFRLLAQDRQTAVMQHLEKFINGMGFASVQARVISGDEEAAFAWQAVQQETGLAEPAILEAGGASIQIAEKDRAASLPAGINALLAAMARHGNIEACYDAILPGLRSFAGCQNLIKTEIENIEPGLLQKLRLKNESAGVFLLGQSASALFNLLESKSFSLTELKEKGRAICQRDEAGFKDLGIETRYQRRSCLLFAYAAVILEASQAKQALQSNATWRDSLARNPAFFSACALKKQIDK
jgi:exopolyphosphatase/pppGpp-phosphohydrolase